jgi:hypothetical protein
MIDPIAINPNPKIFEARKKLATQQNPQIIPPPANKKRNIPVRLPLKCFSLNENGMPPGIKNKIRTIRRLAV